MTNEDALISDILALIHQKEQECEAALLRLRDLRSTIKPAGGILVETAADVGAPRKRVVSAAARARQSRKMKAIWKARKAGKRP